MEIRKVLVVGAGFMGSGIAQVSAAAGQRVTLYDVHEKSLAAGMQAIESSLAKLASKEKITHEQLQATLENLRVTTDMEEACDVDLVMEAAPEVLELKREAFRRLDRICPAHTVFASNTSGLTVSSMAASTARPDRMVGIHFFFPVPLVHLCEVMGGMLTSESTLATADGWVRSLGKETVRALKDHAGFIANRFGSPTTVEALRMIDGGIATPEEIDRATGGWDSGAGPIQLLDYTGLDTGLNALLSIYNDTGDPRFFPPPILRRLVAAGLLGRKTGRGFYDYSSGRSESYGAFAGARAVLDTGSLVQRLLTPGILEAMRVLDAGVASADDIDRAAHRGLGLPAGQLELADNLGLDTLLETATTLYEETGDPRFFPPPILRRLVAAGLLGRKTGRGFHVY
jgi:3-hydroxybutyryl-CoA dehydrogenase